MLLPEGRERAARHALRHRAEGARLRDRHALPLPGDVRALARGRAALRHEGRGVRRPERRAARREARRGALAEQARPLSLDRQGRAARPGARRPRRLDHRRPPRPVADARQRPEARLGHLTRALEGESARRLERRRLLGVHPRARAALQRAARPRLRLDRRHALDAAGRRPRGPLGRQRPHRVRPSRRRRSRHEPVGVAPDRCRISTSSSPRRSTSCARSPPSASGRCCSSRAARTRS